MPHKGEILENVVRKKSNNMAALAKKMNYDRGSLYKHFSDPDLADGIILKYAKALKYNFTNEFPSLASGVLTFEEPLLEYKPMTLSEALKDVDYWKSKYIALLETHTQLLTEFNKK